MKIVVVGTGYVGLVSGTCFSEIGHNVICVDNNQKKIDDLEKGIIPIFEPGLDQLVEKNVKYGRLSFSTKLSEAVKGASAVFIAVGTPPKGDDGGADLTYVYAVAKELANVVEDGTCVITKSTVPVGTNAEVRKTIAKANPSLNFTVASNPEFLREGCAIEDFLSPDRVLVGSDSSDARSIMEEIYRPFTDKNILVLFTDIQTAELTKYAANAFLATKIAFMNEIADICEKVDASIEHLARGIGADHRIGKEYLKPGPGYGGSCFPKDTLALSKISDDVEAPTHIVKTVIESNNQRKKNLSKKIIAFYGGDVKGKVFGVLGLAFKAETDDMRDSPALDIIPALVEAGAIVRAYDPEAMGQAQLALQGVDVEYCNDTISAIKDADAAIILTEWNEFKALEKDDFTNNLKAPTTVMDFRNLFIRQQMIDWKINYLSIGRATVVHN